MIVPEDAEDFNELERIIKEEAGKRTDSVLICPQCNSTDVTYYMGLKTGVQYQCKECGYVGAFIIERDKE
ncbi:MAG TPA: hypothetical protein HA304_06450 [Methanosarcinales archaeon]|nr:hypothetical protein [ANME-2 cluster archaeon]HIH87528.1 hypothetical protein [Methanosarcinales archaeon]